ncbi:hypothetical protein M3Y99_00562800 [Aphelenchoides fujianensis]|nr:hypothetical protein M3Y99_00562800 [Aphelenchoides fujianensis]
MCSQATIKYGANLSELERIFDANGFVLIEDVFTEAEADEMKAEMERIVAGINPEDHPKSVFTTDDEERHASDRFFLNSVANISHFYEEGALDADGKLVVPKDQSINKIGHALHWLNPSMHIFKNPKIGGAVGTHVDATFLRTNPIGNLVGLWIALDEATEENGCLWFIPGSHKQPPADYRFVRTEPKNPNDPLVKFVGQKPVYEEANFVPVPVKKGSMMLIHGLVVHKSEANTSDKSRHAYTLHVADTTSETWDPLNWMQETDDFKFPAVY